MRTLTFRSQHQYADSDSGIQIPIRLRADTARSVRLLAKVDTGADLCIFQRDYAEQLGIDVESGTRRVVSTVNGMFDVYGHAVTLRCLDWEFETVVYFAASPAHRRNVLGREGWLSRFRLAVVDHDATLFLSHYDD